LPSARRSRQARGSRAATSMAPSPSSRCASWQGRSGRGHAATGRQRDGGMEQQAVEQPDDVRQPPSRWRGGRRRTTSSPQGSPTARWALPSPHRPTAGLDQPPEMTSHVTCRGCSSRHSNTSG
jgi:hypothetical protein